MGNWRIVAYAFCLWVLALMLVYPASSFAVEPQGRAKADTLQQRTSTKDMRLGRKMSTSAYPVKIETHGRVVMIHSDYVQLLPIYTRGGVLKMTLRLEKGTNWLNGLPRGNYFINNRPVTVK